MRLCQGLAIILSGEEGHAMGSKKTAFTIGFVPLAFLIALLSCATDEKPLPISKSLPPSELAYYCDSFDSLREDVWERAGFVFSAAQLGNIKIADMTIENGRLRIDTKTGGQKCAPCRRLKLTRQSELRCKILPRNAIPLRQPARLAPGSIILRSTRPRGLSKAKFRLMELQKPDSEILRF
jgi:hypothetical protein